MASVGLKPDNKQLSLDAVVRRVDEISSLPHIAVRVLSVANDPNSGAADLRDLLESDVALSARVLRFVNSSAYALRTKITNLQQAIAYLGLKQIRNLAMTASVSELFAKNDSIGTYSRSSLWEHLVCTLKGISSVGMKLVRPSATTLKNLSLGKNDLMEIGDELDEEIKTNRALFKM